MSNKFTCVLDSFKSTIWFLVCVSFYLYLLLCVLVSFTLVRKSKSGAGDRKGSELLLTTDLSLL